MAASLVIAALLSGCTSSTTDDGSSGIHGTAIMGPTCPVERDPPDPNCADKPYNGRLVVTRGDDPAVSVKEFSTEADGTFNVSVPPGVYRIQSPDDQMLPRCSTQETIAVTAGSFVKADVDCDTGIR